jgi:maleate isomerase
VHGEQLRVGVLTPHTAPGPEVELPALSHGRVDTIVARAETPSDAPGPPAGLPRPAVFELRARAGPDVLDTSAATLRNRSIDAVAHASTTTGYVLGRRAEAALVDHLAQRCGVPAVASSAAAVAGLRACGVERLQIVHPPWFDDEFDALGATYFRDHGFDAWVSKAAQLPGDPAGVTSDHVVDWVVSHLADRAEAVLLAGNGFRTAGAIAELERRTGRIVVGANQALLWGILAATGNPWTLSGYGRLLRTSASTQ